MNTQSKTKVAYITVDENHLNQRIDNFLLNFLKNIPKTHIYKLLRKGEVRINKKRVKAEYKLQINDQIRIPPVFSYDKKPTPGNFIPKIATNIKNYIVYEDDGIMVINKPSGMASHGGSGISFGVIESLRAVFHNAKYLELAHRLDRGTSGCLVIAKKRSVLRILHELLRNGLVKKKYLLLVKGKWSGGERKVNVALAKNQLVSGERIVKVSEAENAKDSMTIFRPVKVFSNATLLEAELKSGRTHQIRVHAAHIGFPIAGDEKYGYDEFNKKMKLFGLKRLFLHSSNIRFKFPGTDKIIDVKCDLDDELKCVLEKMV